MREKPFMKRFGPVLGGIVAIVVIGYGLKAFVDSLGGTNPPPPPPVQQISLLQPPPPPPPPKVEDPPPEEVVEEIETPEEEPIADDSSADEPMPGDELGLDADGTAGSDGFGLQARKGGRSLIGGGDRFKWYAGVVQRDVQSVLAGIDEIRKGKYSAVVRIWVDPQGLIERAEIVRGTGDSVLDTELERVLANDVKISNTPPDDLPQPVKLRINSRA